MKLTKRILVSVACFALLGISWYVAAGARSADEKQAELLAQAAAWIDDKAFVRAAPLLEEAAAYDAERTFEAERTLKEVYLQLAGQSDYNRKYADLLEKQTTRADAPPEVFAEAADYYLGISRLEPALNVLKNGIAKTQNAALIEKYESVRYAFSVSRTSYEEAISIANGYAAVRNGEFWGLASADGSQKIDCEYEKISSYENGRLIAKKDGEIFAVDLNGNRLALLKEEASDFGNYANDRVPILTSSGWRRATGEFEPGNMVFEEIGTYANGYAAAKMDGKWGVVGLSADWLIPAEYDGIVVDELGRCLGQNAAFVREGNVVSLFVNAERVGDVYEDAKPFSQNGYAAVKKDGKWGFIKPNGDVAIPFQFDDALSFGQHLAAVKQGELWGYVSLYGKMAIEPQFFEAKSFSGGNAPVLTERGWQFITLSEYKREASL